MRQELAPVQVAPDPLGLVVVDAQLVPALRAGKALPYRVAKINLHLLQR
jgi:hypothetical protein